MSGCILKCLYLIKSGSYLSLPDGEEDLADFSKDGYS